MTDISAVNYKLILPMRLWNVFRIMVEVQYVMRDERKIWFTGYGLTVYNPNEK